MIITINLFSLKWVWEVVGYVYHQIATSWRSNNPWSRLHFQILDHITLTNPASRKVCYKGLQFHRFPGHNFKMFKRVRQVALTDWEIARQIKFTLFLFYWNLKTFFLLLFILTCIFPLEGTNFWLLETEHCLKNLLLDDRIFKQFLVFNLFLLGFIQKQWKTVIFTSNQKLRNLTRHCFLDWNLN